MVEVRRGIIQGFMGSWMSGLGSLLLQDVDTGCIEQILCENASTVRALEGAFGGVIGSGHSVNQGAIKGKEIFWSYDEFGLVLCAFTPIDEASEELWDYYENNRDGELDDI